MNKPDQVKRESLLHQLARCSFEKAVDYLDSGRILIDEKNKAGIPAIFFAARNQGKDAAKICQLLLDRGFSPNATDSEHENNVLFNCRSSLLELFIHAGTHVNHLNKRQENALFYASGRAMAKVLLKHKINVNQLNQSGNLFFTNKNMKDTVIEEVAPHLDNVNYCNEQGRNIFYFVNNIEKFAHLKADLYQCVTTGKNLLFKNNKKNIAFLLSKGLDPNQQDKYGETPVFYINSDVHLSILVKGGANINHINNEGETALFKYPKYLDEFVRCGIDLNIKNNEGLNFINKEMKLLLATDFTNGLRDDRYDRIKHYFQNYDISEIDLILTECIIERLSSIASITNQPYYLANCINGQEDSTLFNIHKTIVEKQAINQSLQDSTDSKNTHIVRI